MARTRLTMFSADYSGDDWRCLSPHARATLVELLLRPTLSLAGCLAIQSRKWAALLGFDPTDALVELEVAGWIATDDDTEELVIVHHLEHDVTRGNMPTTTLKGLWSAWEAIESGRLRLVVVDHMPDVVWDRTADFAPSLALQLRRSAQIERPDTTARSDGPFLPPDLTARPIQPPPPPPPSPSPATRPDGPLAPLAADVIENGLGHVAALRELTARVPVGPTEDGERA